MLRREKSICVFALAAVLALGACSSDRRTKYIERPAAAPAPTAAQTSLSEAEEARVALVRAQAALTAAQARQAEAEAALRDAQAALNAASARVTAAETALAAQTQGTPEYAAAQTALTAARTARTQAAASLTTAQTSLTTARAAFVSAQRQEQTARAALTAAASAARQAAGTAADRAAAQAQVDAAAAGAARTALETARAETEIARTALAQAATDEARATARAALAAALVAERAAVAAFLTAARTALASAGTAAQRTAAQAQVDAAQAADAGLPWATEAPLAPAAARFVARGEARITGTPRTDTGEEGWRKLAIAAEGVPWAEGRKLLDENGFDASDELPLRAITLRAAGRHPIKIQGDDGTPTSYSNTDGVLLSSIRLTRDGLELKFGGEGVVYYDMQRLFNYFKNINTPDHGDWWRYGPDGKLGDASAAAGQTITASHARDLGLASAGGTLTAQQATALRGYVTDNAGACWRAALSDCGDWAHDDITIAFGRPSQSPQGEAAHHWRIQAPFTQLQRATGLPVNIGTDGRPQEIGTYELWLSNYAGLDTGADADDASDDSHRYLRYAAYGLFTFFDAVVQTPNFVRPQAFAVGYDAFRDASGMRTTDVSTSIAATFSGHTMARHLVGDGSATHVVITGMTPLRGDITLNACIGGSGCSGAGIPTTANAISGSISNLQQLRHDGVWVPLRYGTIPMLEGTIAADGSFKGALDYPRQSDGAINSWNYNSGAPGEGGTSRYGGNFYGPKNALEAAGWWYVQPDDRAAARAAGRSAIIGSFGAKCARGCSP